MTNNNMNNPALVSIIIPTYNCRKYIRQAIDSALSQTYKNIEIIVIDDGSTDNTREEIDDLISEKKISYIYQANKGLPGARNTGIKHSRGKYLVFLDSDDVILPEKIMCQIGFMKEHPDVCLVYSGYQYFKNDNLADLISPPLSKLRGNLYKELLRGCFFTVHSVLVKKACVEKVGCFDESFRASEDWDLYIRLAESGCQFDYIDKVLCLCRLRSDSMCLDWDRIFRSRKKLANKILMNSSRLTPDDRFALRYEDICKSWEMIYYQLRSTEGNGIPDDLHDTIKATRNLYDLIPYNIRSKNPIHKWDESLSTKTSETIESVMLIMDLYEKVYKNTVAMMEKDAIIKNQDARIMNMTSSIRWKITSPLRIALNIVKKLKRSVGEQNRYKSQ